MADAPDDPAAPPPSPRGSVPPAGGAPTPQQQPQPPPPAPGPAITVGGVLGRGFRLYFGNFGRLTLISLLFAAAYVAVEVVVLPFATPVRLATADRLVVRALIVLAAYLVLASTSYGAVGYGAVQLMRGGWPGVLVCIGRAARALGALLVIAFVVGIMATIGALGLIFPAFIILSLYWVSVPAAVVEGIGPFRAMGRSMRLAEGSMWRIFGVIAILWLIYAGVAIVVWLLFLMMRGAAGLEPRLAQIIVDGFVLALMLALQGVMAGVAYHQLAAARDGLSAEDVAKVFD
jgi:hypothetical protein